MKVIWHGNRSGRVPIVVSAAERLNRPKGCGVIEHRPAILDAQGNEVGDGLLMSEPDRYSRWACHAFDCRAAILAANQKETAAKIAALQFV